MLDTTFFVPISKSQKVDQEPLHGPMLRTLPTHLVWKLLDILKREDECVFFFVLEDSRNFPVLAACDPSQVLHEKGSWRCLGPHIFFVCFSVFPIVFSYSFPISYSFL